MHIDRGPNMGKLGLKEAKKAQVEAASKLEETPGSCSHCLQPAHSGRLQELQKEPVRGV